MYKIVQKYCFPSNLIPSTTQNAHKKINNRKHSKKSSKPTIRTIYFATEPTNLFIDGDYNHYSIFTNAMITQFSLVKFYSTAPLPPDNGVNVLCTVYYYILPSDRFNTITEM